MEESRSIDHQISDDWKLGHRLKLDFLGVVFQKSIHQGRAALADSTVDDHRA